MILIFVEFIELNFLGLSEMTKRNIEIRAKLESQEDDINDLSVVLQRGIQIQADKEHHDTDDQKRAAEGSLASHEVKGECTDKAHKTCDDQNERKPF